MPLFQTLPPLAYAAALVFIPHRALTTDFPHAPGAGRFPAVLGLAFTAFTFYQIASDGILMFWANHSVNGIGKQVWFDLLLSVSIGFVLLLPAARRHRMAILPWAIFVGTTASVGLLAMLARLVYLQEQAPEGQAA